MVKYTLKKKEILSGQKQIAELFNSGKSLYKYPLKIFFKYTSQSQINTSPVLFGVTVPKKKFKKAHERNLLKRRIREAYRLNKSDLYDYINGDVELSLMVIYIADKIENYQIIENAVKELIRKLLKEQVN